MVETAQVIQFLIVQGRQQQILIEVATFQFVYLAQKQLLHFVERLPFLGLTCQQEEAVVEHRFSISTGIHHLHLLIQVDVQEACLAVIEHSTDQLERIVLQGRCLFAAPSQPDVLGFEAYNGRVNRLSERLQLGEGGLRDVLAGFPLAEVFLQDGQRLVGVEIACHTDGHVIGHIPLCEVVLDVCDRRILQVLLRADGGLSAVGMRGEKLGEQSLVLFVAVAGKANVVLLIDSLQLGVEAANHHILEAVGLHLCPVLNLVRGNVLHIASHVIRGESIRALTANGGHQFVVLIGNEVLGRELRDAVYLVVLLLTCCLVGYGAIFFVALLNLIQQGSLSLGVCSAKLLCTLEHEVLQVVCQTSCLGRVVLRTCTHSDVSLNARLLFVNREIDLQTVVEGIDARLHGVAVHTFVVTAAIAGHQTTYNSHQKN